MRTHGANRTGSTRVAALLACVAVLLVAPSGAGAQQSAERFELEVGEGVVVRGQVDLPERTGERPAPAVLMVGGTGFFDRHYLYGNSGGGEDLLFERLAAEFLGAGIAVVRFDMRGVRCSQRSMPHCPECETPAERTRHFVESCIVNEDRATVTWDTMLGDLVEVYRHAEGHHGIDPERIAVFAHSEGSIHASRAVGAGEFEPRGLVFMGMVAESPASVLRWQWSSRMAATLLEAVTGDPDAAVTNPEVKAYCERMGIGTDGCEDLLAPEGAWTPETLTDHIAGDAFRAFRDGALANHPQARFHHLYAEHGAVFSSFDWWQRFLTEAEPVAELLVDYPGTVSVHLGELDQATPAERQASVLEEVGPRFRGRLEVRRHSNRGHSLGLDPMLGPIVDEAQTELVEALRRILEPLVESRPAKSEFQDPNVWGPIASGYGIDWRAPILPLPRPLKGSTAWDYHGWMHAAARDRDGDR